MLRKFAGLGLALSCACSAADESPTMRTQAQLVSGPCANQVQLTDLRADFRDIWKGLEVAETGKQASPNASVLLNFSAAVQPASVAGRFAPIVTDGSCGPLIPTALANTVITSIWGTPTTNATRKAQPAPLNVFARDSISGVVSAAGALAAGGDITLSNVSTNWTARQPIGVMAGGKVTLANGSISGDVTYGVPSTIPQTVSISGRKSQQPFVTEDAFQNLAEVANSFANASATGSVQSSYGNLVLTGSNPAVNVFRVAASLLRESTSVQLKIPNGAGAIVDVTGTNIQLQNKGISLQGATPATLLWNFAHANALSISSISIPGAILAPLARLTFDSGNINGTVVVRSFTSAGSGSLQYTALNTALLFGTPVSSSSVALMPVQPLVRGCTYEFSVPNTTPLSSSGSCLDKPLRVTFRVSKDRTAPADRELVGTQLDRANNTLGLLVARTGINTPVLDALRRYEAAIGIPAADLVPGSPKPSFISRTQPVTAYQQVSQGYSVSGYGYALTSESGIFRSAVGRVAPVLPVFPAPSVTQAKALQNVLGSLGIAQPPWVTKPSSFRPPVGVLIILPVKPFPAPADFKLVWTFRFGQGTGINDPLEIQVDAASGAIVASTAGFRAATAPVTTFDPAFAVYQPPPQLIDVETTTINGTKPFTVAKYLHGGNLVATPATGDIAVPGTIASNVDFVGNGNPSDFKFLAGPGSATTWTSTSPGGTQADVASAQWALEQANGFLANLGLESGGQAWAHLDGPAAQQQIIATCLINPAPPLDNNAFYAPSLSNASVARLLFEAFPLLFITPEIVAHEYDHALVDSMRLAAGMKSLSAVRDAASVDEGVADLFALAAANFDNLSGQWACMDDPSGAQQPCMRNVANPHSSLNPEAYLEPLFFKDYSTIPLSGCDDTNERCGSHHNSTIVSHWGYLLAVGSPQGTGPCSLVLAPLDPDLKLSLKIMLNIAHRAITLTGVADKNDPNISFQGFRDATVLAAQKLQDENIYLGHDNLVKAVKLAWDAVALPPDSSDSSSADGIAPPDNSEGVGPWVTFSWPTSGLGQPTPSGVSSWDFQLASSPAFDVPSIKFASTAAKPITDTMDQDGKTLAFFKLSLPYTPSTKFYWRVRPHAATSLWAACYPIHSFTTTGMAPDIKEITFPYFKTDSEPQLQRPGTVVPKWEPVAGATGYKLFLSLTVDSNCESGGDVVERQYPYPPGGGADNLDHIQPEQHYFVAVRPAGPPDFAGSPTFGACAKADFTTAAMRAPQFTNPADQGGLFIPELNAADGVFPLDGTTPPYFVWDALDGPDKYRLEFQEIVPGADNVNINGTCSPIIDDSLTQVITDPCATGICRKQLRGHAFAGRNPSGYCVKITSIAQNEKESPSSMPSRFFFRYNRFAAVAPGVTIGESALHGVSSVVPSGYGNDVTFSWAADPNATQYVVKVAPWPLNQEGPFDPRNCAFLSQPAGSRAPKEDQTGVACGNRSTKPMARELTPTNSLKIPAAKAGKGRYCWWAFPVTGNEADRQAMVDVFPQFCYRTGPDKPKIVFDTPPAPDKFSPAPITGRVTSGYVPDGQLAVSGSPASDFQFNYDKCQADSSQAVYNDVYDCVVEFTITPRPATGYTITARTWDSDQHPPVMDESTLQPLVQQSFATSNCGRSGESCCGGGECEASSFCDGGRCSSCGRSGTACCPPDKGPACDSGVTKVQDSSGCICVGCGEPGVKCCEGPNPCDENTSLPTCQNGKCVAKPDHCPLAQPLGPTFFLSPAKFLDFTHNLPGDCSIKPASVLDPKDPNFRAVFIECPQATYQNAVTNGIIPKLSAMNVNWAIVSGAAGYRVTLGDANAGFNFVDIDQGNPNFSPPLPAGIYSLSVRALDACGNYGSPTETGLVYIGP